MHPVQLTPWRFWGVDRPHPGLHQRDSTIKIRTAVGAGIRLLSRDAGMTVGTHPL